MQRILVFIVISAIVLGAAATWGISQFDGAAAAKRIAAQFESATGRAWFVDGDAVVKIGAKPVIVVRRLSSPNVEWAKRPDFITIDQVEFTGDWWSLVRGEPRIHAVRLRGSEINLATDGEDGNNWHRPQDPRATAGGEMPAGKLGVANIHLEHTLVRFHSGWAEVENEYPIASIVITAADQDKPINLSVKAKFRERPVAIAGTVGTPAALFNNQAFNVALDGNYSGNESDAEIGLNGSIGALAGLNDLSLRFTLSADSLNDVGSISGFALPRDTPVSITAKAVNKGRGPQLEDYVLRIGQAIIRPGS